MKAMASKIVSALLFLAMFVSLPTIAVTPSAAQIEQFKRLPPEQQRALAQQYGVNLDALAGANKTPIPPPVVEVPAVAPRDNDSKNTVLEQAIGDSVVVNKQVKPRSGALQQFGYDLFAGTPSTFAPITNIPVPSEYIVGPGDTVIVQLYGKINFTHELVVNRDGMVQFPEVGPISVVGLNFDELKAFINETVSQKMIGVNASITMGALRSIQVFVLGEAFRPGSYTVSSLSTMTNALLVSGGVTKIGSLRTVQLKRQGEVISELDLYDLLLKGDTTKDMRLQAGDVIFIPPLGKTVGISGEVLRPAIYELKGETTAGEMLALAGGLLPTAYPAASRIERINGNGERTLVNVDLSADKGLQTGVRAGDVLQILPVLQNIEGIVTLSGHVERGGPVSWRPGMRVSDLVGSTTELLPDPDLNYALIKREVLPARTIQVIAINLGQAVNQRNSASNRVLQVRDELMVFARAQERRRAMIKPLLDAMKSQAFSSQPAKIVAVSGNVRFPGEYPLTDNMTSEDLLIAAGGMLESAYGIDAEITRAVIDEQQFQQEMRIQVNFTSRTTAGAMSSKAPLQARDQLFIKRVPGWNEQQFAEIKGEVNFPGRYPIFRGDTIKTLVERAGGLTEHAAPNASIFMRETLRQREQQQIEKFRQRLQTDVAKLKVEATQADATKGDAEKIGASLLSDIITAQATGRLVVDLVAILENKPDSDVMLQNGDVLVLLTKPQEVSVIGEVQFPTSHLYKTGLDVFDYIDNSGGFTPKSDEKYIYVIAANGQVKPVKKGLLGGKNTDVTPGDTVVVPYDVESMSAMNYWLNVSQILFQLSTTAAALNAVGVF